MNCFFILYPSPVSVLFCLWNCWSAYYYAPASSLAFMHFPAVSINFLKDLSLRPPWPPPEGAFRFRKRVQKYGASRSPPNLFTSFFRPASQCAVFQREKF
jgi:hypothetical protein